LLAAQGEMVALVYGNHGPEVPFADTCISSMHPVPLWGGSVSVIDPEPINAARANMSRSGDLVGACSAACPALTQVTHWTLLTSPATPAEKSLVPCEYGGEDAARESSTKKPGNVDVAAGVPHLKGTGCRPHRRHAKRGALCRTRACGSGSGYTARPRAVASQCGLCNIVSAVASSSSVSAAVSSVAYIPGHRNGTWILRCPTLQSAAERASVV
jgi:hypothetical protein